MSLLTLLLLLLLLSTASAEETADRLRLTLERVPGAPLPPLPPGAVLEARGGDLLQITLPAADLPLLADLPGVARIRPPWWADPKAVTTEGYADLFPAGDWHDAGYTGRRQHIVVLDVGLQGADALEGTELPDEVVRLGPGGLETSAHGVAVAEVLHDIAPDAEISFWLVQTDADFLEALERLPTEAGPIDVVNASLGFDNVWHADGTSPLSLAVDAFVAETGAVWVGAAGNEVGRYHIAPLVEQSNGTVTLGDAPAVPLVVRGGGVTASLRWSEPMDAAQVPLRLTILGAEGQVCGEGLSLWAGRPYVFAEAEGCGASAEAVVSLEDGAGPLPSGLEGYLYAPQGFVGDGWAARTRTLTLPADASLGLAVGACDADGAAAYSSQGPTDDGRLKPDLCARGRVSTATYGPEGFEGTSAATPHVAGLAALLWDAGAEDAAAVRRTLAAGARDVGPAGLDVETGHGAAQVGAPPPRCGGRAGLVVALVALGAGWRGRRRGAILAKEMGMW